MPESLPEQTRKDAFHTLVNAQDEGAPVEDSRIHVAAQFHINVDELRSIENEGITKQWAPL